MQIRSAMVSKIAPASLVFLLALVIVGSGCSDESTVGAGSMAGIGIHAVGMESSDVFPSAVSLDPFASAEIVISRVELVPGREGQSGIELLGETPVTLDLMDLEQGEALTITEAQVPAGTYEQLRVVVEEATVTLADGFQFEDGTTTKDLRIPSGDRSGIRVKLLGPVEASTGTFSSLFVDFDVTRNFTIEGNPLTRAGIHDVLFTPVLTENARSSSPTQDPSM